MLLILVFTGYFERSGINKKLAIWFLSRPSVEGRPWFFTFMVFIATLIVGFLLDGNAVNILIWNLLYGIFKEVDYREGDTYPALSLRRCVICRCPVIRSQAMGCPKHYGGRRSPERCRRGI